MNRLALITGGSSGIGLELARLFAADKFDLILAARDQQRLDAVAEELRGKHGVAVQTHSVELGDGDGAKKLAAQVGAKLGELTALVNNAGYGLSGAFAETDLDTELRMITVNCTALTHLTKLALPGMRARKSGYILNVGSTAGFQPGPYMAVYYATKAYVNSFSQALTVELAGTGVHVSALCPGPVETRFQQAAKMDGSRLFKMKGAIVSAEDVAKAGYQAVMKGRSVVVPGFMNKLGGAAQRLLTRDAVTKIAARMNQLEKQ